MSTLILGGGLSGAAAACLLGPEATLVEREARPHHKVCGEFLSWETQAALRLLGVAPEMLGASAIDHVRLVHGDRSVVAALPGRGLGLSRLVLDEALLVRASERGARILRGHIVRRLIPGGADVEGHGPLRAARTLLATGKHDLRDAPRPAGREQLVGFKMLYRLAPAQMAALAGHVEVILFPGGYAGLQPVEAGLANLCLLIRRPEFLAAGGSWAGTVDHLLATSPHLSTRLAAAIQHLDRPLAIARIPYGYVHATRKTDPPDVFRIGDQAGVIPSFSGDGMAIALHTAFAAARASDAAAYHAAIGRDLAGQIGRAMLLHRLGQSRPALITMAARIWPGALAWIARLTRVPQARLAWR